MKKFLMTALLALLTMGASAQLAPQKDTLCITTSYGMKYKYAVEGMSILGDNDSEFLNFWYYDNDGMYTYQHLNRTSISSIRFFNRYSNPLALLQGPREGAYEGLFYTSENPCGMFNFISCLASDEMLGGGGYNDSFGAFDMLSDAGNSMNVAWNAYYSAIENTNTVLERIGFLPMRVSATERDYTRGEALFLRAFYYYQLASLFGNVPVITDNQSWQQKLSPTSSADVWGRILLDLKEAIVLMDGYSPTLTIDDSRVGKYAAEALLARAYLFYTGFHLGVHNIAAQEASVSMPDGSSLTKADVISYVDDCVKNSGFELVGDFRNLWPYTNRLTCEDYSYTAGRGLKWVEDDGAVNPEVLFKIKYNKNASWGTTTGYSNQSALYFGYRYDGYSSTFPFGRGWGAGTVSPGLYDEWKEAEPQDVRRDASIQDVMQLPNYSFGGVWNDFMQETMYHEKKNSPVTCKESYSWQAEDGYMPTFEGSMYGTDDWNNYNFQLGNIHPMNIIRLADVLLMQSELTGTVDGMNKVRQRAGLQPLESYSLAALQQERRWELAFEGVRWNDMRRWGDDYCRQALDKQMGVAIYNRGVPAQNPQGIGVYDGDPRSYGERYAVSRGFFGKPAVQTIEGGPALEMMQGRWTYSQENVSLDYISIDGTHIERNDAMGNPVAEGEVSIKLSDDYDQRICTFCFTNGAMLPLHSGSESGGQLDVIELSDNSMVLRSGSGEQLELRRRTGGEDMLSNVAGIKWSYGTYPSVDWNTGAECVIGTIGLYSWRGFYPTVGTIGIIYAPHIASTTAADLTSFVQTKGWAVAEGETDPFAYMVFNLYDMTISKYTADGQPIATSSFTATKNDDYNIGIHTTGDGILVPYLYNGNGQKEQNFNLRNFDQAPMANYTSPGLVLQSMTEIDNANTYWMFGRLGFTDAELDGKLKLEQTDCYGTPEEEGFFLKVTLDVPADFRYSLVVQDVETNTVLTPDNNNLYQVNVRRGETQVKNIRFTLKNANNIDAMLERTFTMTNNAALTEELMLLASELYGSKTWKWDTSVTGAVWGNMGYCGGSGADVGINGNGQWWGVTSTDEFNNMLHQTHNGMNNGDGDLDAYMVFNENGMATTYDRNGNIVRQGDYQVKDYDANAEWRKGMLVTDAILWPYEINSNGNIPGQYEIVYLTPDKLTLVYPDGGVFSSLGNWSEATFWHFRSDSDVEGMAVGYGQNASKDWTWDYDGQNTLWGNMGYCGGDGSEVGTVHSGQWWGVTNEAEFMEQLSHTNTGTAQGDESMNAYFTLSSDGSIVRHAGDGSVIKSGTFSFDRVEGNAWKVANLNTTAGTILFPYEINSGGHMPETFDVVYLTDKKMCLVYPDGGAFDGLGSWGEATYWHFKKK